MSEMNFLVDVEKCTGCKLCVVACKDEHVDSDYLPWAKPQPETGQFWIDVKAVDRGTAPRMRVNFLPVLCQHCANAPCIKACPDDAIKTRPDGLVWIDPAACTNCGLCAPACPYDVIYMNEDLGIAQKCTGCAHRVDQGDLPRCVEVCPHEALAFGENVAPADAETYHPEFHAAPRVGWLGLPKPWIAGTIIEAGDEEVVEGATITVTDLFQGSETSAQSDAFGDFWLRDLLPDRKYRVRIARDGYREDLSIVTTAGDQDLGVVALERAP